MCVCVCVCVRVHACVCSYAVPYKEYVKWEKLGLSNFSLGKHNVDKGCSNFFFLSKSSTINNIFQKKAS